MSGAGLIEQVLYWGPVWGWFVLMGILAIFMLILEARRTAQEIKRGEQLRRKGRDNR